MEVQLKQRLVGLTVIFSLAVIFLPMLLDGSGLAPKHLEIEIPPAPQMETNVRVQEKVIELERETANLKSLQPLIVDEISDPPDIEAAENDKASVNNEVVVADNNTKLEKPESKVVESVPPTEPAEEKPAPVKPAVTKKSEAKPPTVQKPQVGGDLWVIQTGSFQEKNKAYQQRDRIRKSRLAAVFIEKYKHAGKLSYRVRMGPFLTRDKATVVKNKVRAKYNIKAILMKYEK